MCVAKTQRKEPPREGKQYMKSPKGIGMLDTVTGSQCSESGEGLCKMRSGIRPTEV